MAKKTTKKRTRKGWSQRVTEKSAALDLDPKVFTSHRSPEHRPLAQALRRAEPPLSV